MSYDLIITEEIWQKIQTPLVHWLICLIIPLKIINLSHMLQDS